MKFCYLIFEEIEGTQVFRFKYRTDERKNIKYNDDRRIISDEHNNLFITSHPLHVCRGYTRRI